MSLLTTTAVVRDSSSSLANPLKSILKRPSAQHSGIYRRDGGRAAVGQLPPANTSRSGGGYPQPRRGSRGVVGGSRGGAAESCYRCRQPVYPTGRVQLSRRMVFHPRCLACLSCGLRLTLRSFQLSDGANPEVYCQHHLPSIRGATGGEYLGEVGIRDALGYFNSQLNNSNLSVNSRESTASYQRPANTKCDYYQRIYHSFQHIRSMESFGCGDSLRGSVNSFAVDEQPRIKRRPTFNEQVLVVQISPDESSCDSDAEESDEPATPQNEVAPWSSSSGNNSKPFAESPTSPNRQVEPSSFREQSESVLAKLPPTTHSSKGVTNTMTRGYVDRNGSVSWSIHPGDDDDSTGTDNPFTQPSRSALTSYFRRATEKPTGQPASDRSTEMPHVTSSSVVDRKAPITKDTDGLSRIAKSDPSPPPRGSDIGPTQFRLFSMSRPKSLPLSHVDMSNNALHSSDDAPKPAPLREVENRRKTLMERRAMFLAAQPPTTEVAPKLKLPPKTSSPTAKLPVEAPAIPESISSNLSVMNHAAKLHCSSTPTRLLETDIDSVMSPLNAATQSTDDVLVDDLNLALIPRLLHWKADCKQKCSTISPEQPRRHSIPFGEQAYSKLEQITNIDTTEPVMTRSTCDGIIPRFPTPQGSSSATICKLRQPLSHNMPEANDTDTDTYSLRNGEVKQGSSCTEGTKTSVIKIPSVRKSSKVLETWMNKEVMNLSDNSTEIFRRNQPTVSNVSDASVHTAESSDILGNLVPRGGSPDTDDYEEDSGIDISIASSKSQVTNAPATRLSSKLFDKPTGRTRRLLTDAHDVLRKSDPLSYELRAKATTTDVSPNRGKSEQLLNNESKDYQSPVLQSPYYSCTSDFYIEMDKAVNDIGKDIKSIDNVLSRLGVQNRNILDRMADLTDNDDMGSMSDVEIETRYSSSETMPNVHQTISLERSKHSKEREFEGCESIAVIQGVPTLDHAFVS